MQVCGSSYWALLQRVSQPHDSQPLSCRFCSLERQPGPFTMAVTKCGRWRLSKQTNLQEPIRSNSSILTLRQEHSTPCFQGMTLMTSAMDEAGNVLLTHVNKLWAQTVGYTLLLVSSGKFKVGDNTSKSPWPLYQVASHSSYVSLGV